MGAVSSFKPPENSFFEIRDRLARELSVVLPLKQRDIAPLLEQPKRPERGHLALPVFSHSQKRGIPPPALAEEWADGIRKKPSAVLEKTEAISGFINFTFHGGFLKSRLESLLQKQEPARFSGNSQSHWVMDFASPNVAKHMNMGHLRAGVLGRTLVNLTRRFDIRVTAVNHLGDWGTQFGKLLWAYQNRSGKGDGNTAVSLDSLAALYTDFHKEAAADPEKNRRAAELFKKLEAGDRDLLALWKKFVQVSLEDYDRYWKKLNVKHDLILGESFYRNLTDDLQERLREKKLLRESDGARVVFLEGGAPPCLIEKSDGASTYAARDLSAAIYRFETLKADRNIYITGSDQKLHFQQVFQTLGKLHPDWEASCRHVAFGMYRFKGEGKMSSRRGRAVYLKDVLEQAQGRVERIIKARRPEMENKSRIAEQVSVGAVIFNDLQQDCIKDVDFNWDRLLDFEGRTGPFVQYAHVRCLSLMEKYRRPPPKGFSKDFSFDEGEKKLAWLLLCFEEAVFQSFRLFKPHILAGYLLDLAGEFNRFYSSHRILDSQQAADRMALTGGVRRILKTGLEILNIPLPPKM